MHPPLSGVLVVVVFPIVSTPEYRINVIVTGDLLKDAANVLVRSYSMNTLL